eukprot:COSAG02_NODE_35751_length_464_cov_0.734247_2_plen_22_part_01
MTLSRGSFGMVTIGAEDGPDDD